MNFLINVVLGLLAGWLTDYILTRVGVANPIRVGIAVIVGVLVFMANFAVQITAQ